MSKQKQNEIVPIENYAIMGYTPAEFKETMLANLGEGDMLSVNDLQRVKLPTGGMTIWQVPGIKGNENLAELEGIMLYWHQHRGYWQKSMEQGGQSAPDCSSPDGIIGRVREGSEAEDKGQGGKCADCPMSKYGSHADGKRQACKLMRRVFLLRPGRMLPTVVNLAPTSVGAHKSFCTNLTAENIPYYRAMVSIGLEIDQSASNVDYAKATFTLTDIMEGEMAERFKEFRDSMLPYLKSVEITDEDR